MTETTCSVPNCARPIRTKGYCYSHYMKLWRYGTPTPEFKPNWVDIVGIRFGSLIVVNRVGNKWLCRCDCGKDRTASAGELNRTGSNASCGDRATHRRKLDAGYGAAHDRVRRANGSASAYQCIDCGHDAQHWSYDHLDPDELQDTAQGRNPIAYSLKVSHYKPRCVPCHKAYDLADNRTA